MNINSKKALDIILQFCLKNENVDMSKIKRDLFNKINDDQLLLILHEIDNYHPKIAEIRFSRYNAYISSNGLTQDFLIQGGFTEIHKQKENELKKEKELKNLEFKLAKSNLKANKLNEKIAKRNKRETVINIILGAINIGLLIWQILKPE